MTAGGGAGRRFELFLAWRYLRSTRSDAFISLLSRITALGLALGVAALVLALALLSGFQNVLVTDLRQHTPTLDVELGSDADLETVERAVAETAGVAAVQRMVSGRGWLRLGDDVEPVELLGFGKRLPGWLPRYRVGEAEADFPADHPSIWLSSSLAEQWLLARGETVEVVSPVMTLTPLGRQPRSSRLEVAGTYFPGKADERLAERLALPFDTARRLLGSTPLSLDVEVAEGVDEETLARRLRTVLAANPASEGADVMVSTWRDQHRSLRFVLRLEKSMVFLAVALIVLVASFALVAALSLILSSKRQELAILSAMGAQATTLQRIFLLLGALLSVIGTTLGAALGGLLAVGLDRFQLLPLPGDVYLVDYVPFLVRPGDVLVVVGAAFLLTLVAAAVAARKADVLVVAEVLKH